MKNKYSLLKLAFYSLSARKITVGMTIFSVALSVILFLGVEKIRTGAKANFTETISGTDLILGARTGSIQLLLYSVFHIGNATNNISWESYLDIKSRPEIDWIVPISLGDSHKQFRVIGTANNFFEHFRYGNNFKLELSQGKYFGQLFDVVIGADVAKILNYDLDTPIIIAHGLSSMHQHDDYKFKVSGILRKTGTPIDQSIFISLQGYEAIHVDWKQGFKNKENATPTEALKKIDLTPKAITAAYIGTKSKLNIFSLQRAINIYPKEPLMAIIPGLALQELWKTMSVVEKALFIISAMVVFTAIIGLAATLFTALSERRREMAILRALGASPFHIFGLLLAEAILIIISGVIIGYISLYVGLFLFQPFFNELFGIYLPIDLPTQKEIFMVLFIVILASFASLIPAVRAYKISLTDGMSVKT